MEIADKVVAFLAKTKGRDKSIRVFQYITRGMNDGLKGGSLAELADRAQKVSAALAMTRKVLRFGLPIGITLNLLKRGWRDLFRSAADLSLLLYFLSDHLLYFYKVGAVKAPSYAGKVDLWNNIFWIFDNVFTIIADCLDIHRVQTSIQEIVDKNLHVQHSQQRKEYEALLQKSDLLVWDIIRAAGDIPLCIFFIDNSKFNPVFIAALGTLTSLIGCYQVWRS
mmetsp:Transcript_18773/g.34034  ORF Transcript_18773/g.34034 Transcript_18773/m.34034 type:complete len:223 (-) Transcript_18773:31-699(-)